MLEIVSQYFEELVELSIIILEFIGLLVLMCSAFKSIAGFFKREARIRLSLAEGIALALEFKLGSEVLRTVIVRETSELIILGGIIIMRAALTLLIHWEIKNEKTEDLNIQNEDKR